jgi:hypothetical protein
MFMWVLLLELLKNVYLSMWYKTYYPSCLCFRNNLGKEKEMLRYRLVGKSGGQNLVAGTLEESWSAKKILLKGSSQCGGYHTLLFPQLVESF